MNYRKKITPSKGLLPPNKLKMLEVLEVLGYSVEALDDYYYLVKITKNTKHYIMNLSTNINPTNIREIFRDKIATYRLLDFLNINYPKGFYFHFHKLYRFDSLKDLDETVKKHFQETPFVLKPKDSYKSKGIHIFPHYSNRDKLKKALLNVLLFSDTVILQEYIDGQEYRLVCIKGKIKFGIKKYEDVYKNTRCHDIELIEFQYLAQKIYQYTKAELYAIDLIKRNDEHFVLELNSQPSLANSIHAYSEEDILFFYG